MDNKTEEFFQSKNGGKSSQLALEHGELISPVWTVELMEQYAQQREMDKQLKQLIEEINKYNIICDKLMDQRYTTQKYEDRWVDELFQKYQTIKTRIQLLIEIISNQEESNG